MHSTKFRIILLALGLFQVTNSFHKPSSYDGISRNWVFEYGRSPALRNAKLIPNTNGIMFHRPHNDWSNFVNTPVYYPSLMYKRFRYPPGIPYLHSLPNKQRALYGRLMPVMHQTPRLKPVLSNRLPSYPMPFMNLSHHLRTTKTTHFQNLPMTSKKQFTPIYSKPKATPPPSTTESSLKPTNPLYPMPNNCLNEGMNKVREVFFIYNNTACFDTRPTPAQSLEFIPLNKPKITMPTQNYEYRVHLDEFRPHSLSSTNTIAPQNSAQTLHYFFTIKDAITPHTPNKSSSQTIKKVYSTPNYVTSFKYNKEIIQSLRNDPTTTASNNAYRGNRSYVDSTNALPPTKSYNAHRYRNIYSFFGEGEEIMTTKATRTYSTEIYDNLKTTIMVAPIKPEKATDLMANSNDHKTDIIAPVKTTQSLITTTEIFKDPIDKFYKSTYLLNEELTTQDSITTPPTTKATVQRIYKSNTTINKIRAANSKKKFAIINSTASNMRISTFKERSNFRPSAMHSTTPLTTQLETVTKLSSTSNKHIKTTPTVLIKKFKAKKRFRFTPTSTTSSPLISSAISTTLASKQSSNNSSNHRKSKPSRHTRNFNKTVRITKSSQPKLETKSTSVSKTTSLEQPPQPQPSKPQTTAALHLQDMTSNTPESAIMRISNSSPSKTTSTRGTSHSPNIAKLQRLRAGYVPELPIETYFKEVTDTHTRKVN